MGFPQLVDRGFTDYRILDHYGQDVAIDAKAHTGDDSLSYKRSKILDSLGRIKEQPKEVWMVKMADRISNLQPPPEHWTEEKIEAYREEARMIYEELKEGSEYLSIRLLQKIESYKYMIIQN